MKIRYNLFLDEELIAKLKIIAKNKDVTTSALIRKILQAWVNAFDAKRT